MGFFWGIPAPLMPESVGGIGVTRAAKVSAVTGGGRDDVPVADALPGRADAAAGGAAPDSEDADRRQPRRAHLRQRGGAVVARGDRAHTPCRQ